MRTLLLWGILIGSATWVAIDSRKHRIPVNRKPYSFNNGALAWFLSCIVLWIGMFPLYLYRRSKALKSQGRSSTVATVLGLVAIAVVVLVVALR